MSFFSNAYATLLAKSERGNNFPIIAAVLAFAAYALVVAFGRLDKRNEQIIEINEKPLKLIQAVYESQFGGTHWRTFERSDREAYFGRTFGHLLPFMYVAASVLAASGGAYGLYAARVLNGDAAILCTFLLILAGVGLVWLPGPLRSSRPWHRFKAWRRSVRKVGRNGVVPAPDTA